MDTMIISEIHDALQERLARGDHDAALVYLHENFTKLPEEMQGEILTRAYLSAIQEEIERAETIGEIQKQAISAIKVLEVLKEELEKQET